MISVEEALTRILEPIKPVATETVALTQLDHRVLAKDVVARRTQPPQDVSAMDGYAVRSADLSKPPVTLKVIGEAPAGTAYDGEVKTGEAVRIFTGGSMPNGADCVVIQEDVEAQDTGVTIKEAFPINDNVRKKGIDFAAGDALLHAGTRIDPSHIALAAAMNVTWFSVYRRPRVAILATGDELAEPGQATHDSQIISSTVYSLGAYLRRWGAEPIDLGIAADTLEDIQGAIDQAQGCDLLVTLGGASVGDYDFVQQALTNKGMSLDFWKVAMRPGKPLMYGQLDQMPVLGLPGNPVSALVCAMLFLRPCVSKLSGCSVNESHMISQAATASALDANGPRQNYLRGKLIPGKEGLTVKVLNRQDSSVLSVFAEADCLIIRPPHSPKISVGELVTVLLLT